jgi:hypothetical protein
MPLFLSRNRPLDRTIIDHRRRQVRRGVITSVRDVCGACNGGILSRLDAYAADLDREYFTRAVGFSPVVRFKYDFDLLLRWLLKISYNDDRSGAPPYEAEPFVPYILGREQIPHLRTKLLLGLIEPSHTSQQERSTPQTVEPPELWSWKARY